MKKKWLAGLCALALVFACALGLFGSAFAVSGKTIYFTAVNDTILELTDETMPFLANGEVYVPYDVFNPNTTGIKLGVYASYGDNVVVLYGQTNGALVFDLAKDTATSSTGKKVSKRAIRHNSTIFVPVNSVVSYFGLDWSLLPSHDYGMVVRVKGQDAQIRDRDFLTAGDYTMESRYTAYLKANGLWEPSAPTPSVPHIPSYEEILQQEQQDKPTQTPRPSVQPSPSPSPSPSQSDAPKPEGGEVYVAVRCAPGGDTAALAAALGRQNAQGVFFFPVEALAGRDDEVRALAASGHKVGLLLDGETPEQRQAQAEEGSRLMAHILRAGTDLALMAEGAGVPEGWLAWPEAVDGTAGARSAAQQMEEVLEEAVRPDVTFLLLDDGVQTAGVAVHLFGKMAEEGCTFRLGLEPVLASYS